jgi:hypothetical protein
VVYDGDDCGQNKVEGRLPFMVTKVGPGLMCLRRTISISVTILFTDYSVFKFLKL